MPKLKAAVQAMQDEGSVPRERCLNVVINVPGPKRDPKKLLPMTLLAFAGYHKRQEMIHFLIQNHARMFALHCMNRVWSLTKPTIPTNLHLLCAL